MLLKFSLIWIPLLTMEISLIHMIFQKKKSFNRNLHNKSKEYILLGFTFDMKIPPIYWIKLNNPISFYQNFPNFLNRFIFSRFQNVEKKKNEKRNRIRKLFNHGNYHFSRTPVTVSRDIKRGSIEWNYSVVNFNGNSFPFSYVEATND